MTHQRPAAPAVGPGGPRPGSTPTPSRASTAGKADGKRDAARSWARSSPTCRRSCTPRGYTGGRRSVSAGAAGHGHRGEGRRAQPHRRPARSQRHAAEVVQEAHRGGARPRLPVADRAARRPARGRSGASTGPTTRTCWWRRCTGWRRRRRSSAATRRSTPSRNASPRTGTTVVKCMLHLSAEEQRERLLARLDDPHKQWKFKPGDVDERGRWEEYRAAYAAALERCNTGERTLVRRAQRPEVVPQLGGRHAAAGGAACARPATGRRPATTWRSSGRGSSTTAGRSREPADRHRDPVRRAVARGRLAARASSRPTTWAPTCASSVAPGRACRCWWPR